MCKELLTPEIIRLVRERQWAVLRQTLVVRPPAETAELIESIEEPIRVLLLRFLPRGYSAEVFAELTPGRQDDLLRELTNHEVRELLAGLSVDDRVALISEMPAGVTRRLFSLLSEEELANTRQYLGYPEGSAGRMMTPDFIDIKADMTVEEALARIRENGAKSETLDVVYVTGEAGKLLDEIPLRRLVLAQEEKTVAELMDGSVVSLSGYSGQKEAVEMIRKYNYLALPVVDSEGTLLGIVTVDDLMDAAQAADTKDFHRFGAVSVKRCGAYSGESVREAAVSALFRRRIVWLAPLILVNILSGFGLSFFTGTIAAAAALVFLLPLLIGCGGNAGSQSATLVVRALATGGVKPADLRLMLLKELKVALMLGGTMAAAVSLAALFFPGVNVRVGLSAALSMALIIMVGCLLGLLLPFILEKFGKDPAAASAPLVASLVDICGVMIYFSLASKIVGIEG